MTATPRFPKVRKEDLRLREVRVMEEDPFPRVPMGTLTLRLDKPNWIPKKIVQRIEAHTEALRADQYMENLVKEGPLGRIAYDLEKFICNNYVFGYHCTKEIRPGFFKEAGLRVLDRESHQAEFLARHGHLFSPEEREAMQAAWSSYFVGPQDEGRNGRVHFCLLRKEIGGRGTDRFHEYFGGEAVWKALDENQHASILQKLRGMGVPVVAEVRINPNELAIRFESRLAITALSHYHATLNPEAYPHSMSGQLRRDIKPSEVLRVILKENFAEEGSDH